MTTPRAHISILKKFLHQFTPPTSHKRKYTHNEFSFVHHTISKIFLQQINTAISETELATTLSELNYTFYIHEGESGLIKNESKRNTKNKAPHIPFFDFEPDVFIYLNISSTTIRELNDSTRSINYKKNPAKIQRITLLKQKITDFFQSNPAS